MKVYLVGGAVRDLVMSLPERLWLELTKVFKENTCYKFFNILSDLDVLKNLFPGVYDQRYLLIPSSINNLSEKY